MSGVTFNNQKAIFFRSIQAKVEQYFEEKNIKKTGNSRLYIKTAILLVAAVVMYTVLITVSLPPGIAILICCLFGITQAGIGFNIMHDANHGSFSGRKWVNSTMSMSANVMGVNAWFWRQKHNIIHHTYTNVDGVDDDIIKSPFLRMCHSQKHMPMHKFQYIYCIFLYGFTSLMWIFVSDFIQYFQRKISTTKVRGMVPKEHFIFWISKALYCFLFIALPIYLLGWLPVLVGFSIIHFVLGVTISVVFQLAHVVEATHFVDGNSKSIKIEDEWAVHQVRSTADFATGNKIVSWFTGGLNYQVEHHLFPNISHVHYPVIHKIVKEECKNHKVRFNAYPSLTSALLSHLRFLKQLGVQ